MSTDPRTLDKVVRRIMFSRRAKCLVRVIRTNTIQQTGTTWTGYEPCGELATYASVKKGNVSPRCEKHAKSDAKRWGVAIDENPALESTPRIRDLAKMLREDEP